MWVGDAKSVRDGFANLASLVRAKDWSQIEGGHRCGYHPLMRLDVRFKCGLPRRGVMLGSSVDGATRQASTSRSRLVAFDRVVRTALDAWKRRVKRRKSLKIGQHRGDSFFLWISWHSVRTGSVSEQFVSFDGKRRASNRLQPGPSHSRRLIR